MVSSKKYYVVQNKNETNEDFKLPVTLDRFEELVKEAYHSGKSFVVNNWEEEKVLIIYE